LLFSTRLLSYSLVNNSLGMLPQLRRVKRYSSAKPDAQDATK